MAAGFAEWTKRHGLKRKKLTGNRHCDLGVQVVTLQRSQYALEHYLRYGVSLEPTTGFLQEPECDIRLPVDGPWGRRPAIAEGTEVTAEQVVDLLERYIVPLMRRTESRSDLERLRASGGLKGAAVLKQARDFLGWPP